MRMNYTLHQTPRSKKEGANLASFRHLVPLLKQEKTSLAWALLAILLNAGALLLGPIIISRTVDTAIQNKDFSQVLLFSGILLAVYLIGLGGNYFQTTLMGGVGRRTLYNLRNTLFTKLQELPVAFFHQNKAGDLISRINNDTDKLNLFFAQALMQFVGNFFLMMGAGVLLISLQPKLGLFSLLPAGAVLVVTNVISPWVKRQNLKSLEAVGNMSAEIQESLSNFKVIVAFNRLDYFRQKFKEVNEKNFQASIQAALANTIFQPIYGLAAQLAQLVVLAYGIALISQGKFSVGLLIGFLLYVHNFYTPLRQLAMVWPSFQQASAGLERIYEVLRLSSNLPVLPSSSAASSPFILEFRDVSFRYPEGKDVLMHANFRLEPGKTYAFVGPTGGGKTTTASLMARLYDPTEGTVLFEGRDIRTYSSEERAANIGFILQEPFLFHGTLLENIFYGQDLSTHTSPEALIELIHQSGLGALLDRFQNNLNIPLQTGGERMSLGQRQLIAFMRAVLRKPKLLILDEATANIDTVTEQLLEDALRALPQHTTKVIIAHRLNTIENADEIFFVNNTEVTAAGSLEHAVDMLMRGKRKS